MKCPAPEKFVPPRLRAQARAGDAFIANIGAAVAQIQANRAGAASGRDPEHLHQLRVGIRRLRSTLLACRGLLRRTEADRLDRRLRDALRVLGAARDWDVFEAAFRRAGLPRRAREKAEAARRRGSAMARSARLRFLPEEALAWAKSRPWRRSANPGEPITEFSRRALGRAYARLLKTADGIDWRDAPRRHRVRIRVKRLRYACDCFAAAWTEVESIRFARALRRLQEILGELNDVEVQRGLLEAVGLTGASPWTAAAARGLARRESRLLPKLRGSWRRFAAVNPYWRATETASRSE